MAMSTERLEQLRRTLRAWAKISADSDARALNDAAKAIDELLFIKEKRPPAKATSD